MSTRVTEEAWKRLCATHREWRTLRGLEPEDETDQKAGDDQDQKAEEDQKAVDGQQAENVQQAEDVQREAAVQQAPHDTAPVVTPAATPGVVVTAAAVNADAALPTSPPPPSGLPTSPPPRTGLVPRILPPVKSEPVTVDVLMDFFKQFSSQRQ